MAARSGRPLLIVDIAVPRDVDPAVAELPGVTLLDMDDLRAFAEAGSTSVAGRSPQVRAIVAEELGASRRARDRPRGRAPRHRAARPGRSNRGTAELDRYRSRLDRLDAREREAVEALTKGIVAKLLHEPTVRLKDAAGTPQGDRLADALRDLFDL